MRPVQHKNWSISHMSTFLFQLALKSENMAYTEFDFKCQVYPSSEFLWVWEINFLHEIILTYRQDFRMTVLPQMLKWGFVTSSSPSETMISIEKLLVVNWEAWPQEMQVRQACQLLTQVNRAQKTSIPAASGC